MLATVADELAQVSYVVERILERREAGVPLRQQAVLFRTAHHSDALEVELGRRNIPFVKFGGLRFLEAAHVKDALACLRWAENPRDSLAGFRVAQLLPGMGPRLADALVRHLAGARFALPPALASFDPPAAARADWPAFAELFARLTDAAAPWAAHMGLVRRWYEPHVARLYDNARARLADLEQLEQLAAAAPSRERFLSDLTLDPPAGTGAEAAAPHLDEDYLILSTIHSAKGQEWDSVFVLYAADGCIPSDLATGTPAEIEEERRLLYVAMTRAKNFLAVVHPLRFFIRQQHRLGDRHVFTPRTRFIPDAIVDKFARVAPSAVRRPGRAAARARRAAHRRRRPPARDLGDAHARRPRDRLASAVADIDLVIFDLDGTLVDTVPDIAAALEGTLTAAGVAAPPVAVVKGLVGDGGRELIRRALAARGRGRRSRRLFAAFLAAYRAHVSERSAVYPGVTDALDRLRTPASRAR